MKEMQCEQVLLALIMNQIMSNPLDEETPSSRLKQVGLMTAICAFGRDGKVFTLSGLVNMTGLTRGGIVETVGPLVQRGLLIETMGKNAMGRGTARYFEKAPAVEAAVDTVLGGPFGRNK